jgi:hypothetical protein
MKSLVVFMLLRSCALHKSTSEEIVESESLEVKIENYRIVGIVVTSDECPVYIDATEDGNSIRIFPINLDERFKVNGMRLKFDYKEVTEKIPLNCTADKVVELNDVTPVR